MKYFESNFLWKSVAEESFKTNVIQLYPSCRVKPSSSICIRLSQKLALLPFWVNVFCVSVHFDCWGLDKMERSRDQVRLDTRLDARMPATEKERFGLLNWSAYVGPMNTRIVCTGNKDWKMLLIETKMLANINQRQSWTDGTIAGLFSRQVRDTGIVGVPRVIPPFSPHPSRVHNSSTKKEQRERAV